MIFPFFLAYHAYALPSQPCIIQFQFLPSVKMGEGADSVISSRFLLVLRKEDFQVRNLLFFSLLVEKIHMTDSFTLRS